MSKVTVVVARHGDKSKEKGVDALTPLGAMQIFGLAQELKKLYGAIPIVAYSGAKRTHQCANIAVTAMESYKNTFVAEDSEFHFNEPFELVFKSQMAPYLAECEKIKAAGGTMKEALEISEYTRVAKGYITKAILNFAEKAEAANESVVLAFSHGSYAEFAVPERQLKDFPYMIPMGSAIAYTVEDGVITNAEFIPAVA
jgi:hypothetical protein